MAETFELLPGTGIQVWRFKGAAPGPKVLITAGIHGREYPGILTARRLLALFEEGVAAGEVTVVLLVNPAAFDARSKAVNPEDGENINRMFPGDPEGTASQRRAWAITKLQDEADFYIDLHGGDLFEDLWPYVYVPGNCAPEVTVRAREVAEHLSVPVRVLSQASTGAYNSAAIRGTPSILIERGSLGLWSEADVEAYMADLKSILAFLGVIKGEAVKNRAQREAPVASYVSSRHSGFWFPNVRPGSFVKAGETLGRIENFAGGVLDTVVAPHDGNVLYMTVTLSAPAGCDLVALG